MGPLLAIFPHPDDETFTAAGLMAAAAERGIPVTLICATRGELGESSLPGLDDPEQLGRVREDELRDAMRHLGISDVRFLGYRDSGMEGSTEADHPRAFVRVPIETVASALAAIIRDLEPGVVVTYGPDGVYGHPDHLHLHQAALRAVLLAGEPSLTIAGSAGVWQTPALYYGTAPREELLAAFDRPNSPLPSLSETARANLGTPRDQITHVLDVRPWADLKRAAFTAHVTQTGDGGPLSGIASDVLEARLGREHFVRATLSWSLPAADPDFVEQLVREQPTA